MKAMKAMKDIETHFGAFPPEAYAIMNEQGRYDLLSGATRIEAARAALRGFR